MDKEGLRQMAEQAREEAWQLSKLEEGWTKVGKEFGGGAVLEWREGVPGSISRGDGMEGGKGVWRCWRLQAPMEAEADVVEKVIMDIDRMHVWNPALTKTQVRSEGIAS
jgi:hypothetical protein